MTILCYRNTLVQRPIKLLCTLFLWSQPRRETSRSYVVFASVPEEVILLAGVYDYFLIIMAQQLQTQVRNPPPRMLTNHETLQTLNHWKTSFRTYYRRDSYYKGFLLPDAAWNSTAANYGQTADRQDANVVRSAADKAGDLEDFLNNLAGYLPFPYLTEKIVKASTKLQDVWDIIYDHYGVNVTSESLLDYVAIKQVSGETYRQFFDRLLSHARLHLPKPNITVDGINSGANGEVMTISLMNFVAMDWLSKINPQLIDIVKTEYSRELRDNTQLVALVPRIASNIDALLARHDIVGGVDHLAVVEDGPSVVDKVNRVRHGRGGGNNFRGRFNGKNFTRKKSFCPECHLLGRKLHLDVKYDHLPAECPRPGAAVNMILAEEEDYEDDDATENVDYTGKNVRVCSIIETNSTKQMNHDQDHDTAATSTSNPEFYSDCSHESFECSIVNKILRLEQRFKEGVRKEYSPQLRTKIGNVFADSTVDEGSELNCIDSTIAAKCSIKYDPIKLSAMAAGSNIMKLLGVVPNDILLQVCDSSSPITIRIKNAVVVKNLGSNVLIGEPGKFDNNIITYPRQKLIQLTDNHGRVVKLPYHSRRGAPGQHYKAYQVKTNTTLYPNQHLKIPVPPSMQCSNVNVTLRRDFVVSDPVLDNAKKGYISIRNNGNNIVNIPKHSHIADIRTCHQINTSDINPTNLRKIYDISREDWSHLTMPNCVPDDKKSYIDQVSVDPDNQMPVAWKNRFINLCKDFNDIITPVPGRYNGTFGRVSTDINFTSVPPSNPKAYVPRYSHEMLKVLGDKMDVLEQWGVLQKPEELGVVPEFVVPSLLVPKPEKNEWRMVSDFTSLNKYIKKLPAVSPTIQEAKEKIAKFKYHVFLDLSNYFFQGGVKIEDSQYLATIHPFKGLMCYTVSPQGLLNSGEQAYERLGRVYGDLCSAEKMTRMADGLYVLANTYSDLFENLKEVFDRARIANLTFKPSKIVICPVDTVVFGWRMKGNAWIPTQHTTNPIINASLPVTVKQLRSWIGSYKQLSSCIRNYSVPLSKLEKLTGSDKSSSMRIQWTEELKADFEHAKEKIKSLEYIYTPTPDDRIQTYSDYSQEHNAVGGQMIIVRKEGDKEVKLNGGFFSARLGKLQSRWLVCELESVGVKLVLEHFSHFIRENKNVVLHFTDSLPTVQAFKRAKLGAFSSSARIASFLSSVSSLNVDIHHIPGKQLQLVDWISRHPNTCPERSCQICKFVDQQIEIGDSVAKLNSIQIQDILSGNLAIPFTQRQSWIDAQNHDKTHVTLKHLISTSQSPEKKKTRNENTKLKLLFNLYREGKLKVHKDGLITVGHTETNGNQYQAISVPTTLFPGLIHALHYKLSHPSKLQLCKLISRHFYTPGYNRIIEEVSDACEMCCALKQLPKEMFSESTGHIAGFGTNFSADVIERNSQQILIVREKLSSFTFTKFVCDQKAETLKQALISLIIEYVPHSGTTVQVDCATAWASLSKESDIDNSDLKKLKIKIGLGRHHNVNKNPVSDNACKEFHKEVLRLKPEGSILSEVERAIVTSNMNQRIRRSGFSSREICFKRDLVLNKHKEVDDNIIAGDIVDLRMKHHNKTSNDVTASSWSVGLNVFLKSDKSKLKARQLYRIVDLFHKDDEKWATIQKHDSQFRAKKYQVKLTELLPLPGQTIAKSSEDSKPPVRSRPVRKSAEKARELFSRLGSVRFKETVPTHGWDYDKMMKYFEDEDDCFTLVEGIDISNRDDIIDSSDSPTNESSDDFDDAAGDNSDSSTLSQSSTNSTQPPLHPKLPRDLSAVQNLSEQLLIPEVQIAVSPMLQDLVDDMRTFNSQHPRPPPVHMTGRRSARIPPTPRPLNYAEYNRTGKK